MRRRRRQSVLVKCPNWKVNSKDTVMRMNSWMSGLSETFVKQPNTRKYLKIPAKYQSNLISIVKIALAKLLAASPSYQSDLSPPPPVNLRTTSRLFHASFYFHLAWSTPNVGVYNSLHALSEFFRAYLSYFIRFAVPCHDSLSLSIYFAISISLSLSLYHCLYLRLFSVNILRVFITIFIAISSQQSTTSPACQLPVLSVFF